MREPIKYVANFQRVGGVYDETLTLLKEFYQWESWEAVKSAVFEENLLQKNSRHWMVDILRTVKRRYVNDHQPLPNGYLVSKFMVKNVSRQSKIQILYQYLCHSDPLIDRLIRGLVCPNLGNFVNFRLTKALYNEFLDNEVRAHPELSSWSPSVKGKLQRNFFAFLRSSGIMAKSPSLEVRRPVVRPESFIFVIHGMRDSGLSVTECLKSYVWDRYFLDSEGVEEMLGAGQKRGWLQFRRLGSIVELKLSYFSMEDWLDGALGQ
ncbi:hypothetical protein ES703_42323 [subsurface metagenome]